MRPSDTNNRLRTVDQQSSSVRAIRSNSSPARRARSAFRGAPAWSVLALAFGACNSPTGLVGSSAGQAHRSSPPRDTPRLGTTSQALSLELPGATIGPRVEGEEGAYRHRITSAGDEPLEVARNPLGFLCTVEQDSADAHSDGWVVCTPAARVASAEATVDCSATTDSDGDELSDCDELRRFFTNPWLADTDGDEFSDGEEVPLTDGGVVQSTRG